MKTLIKRLNNPKTNLETGSILVAMPGVPITPESKAIIDASLRHFAYTKLYPGEGLNIYSSIYADTPSIVVIRDINNIDYSEGDFNLVVEY